MPSPAKSAATGPGTQALVDSQALLRHLEWTVLRRLDGLLHGDWRTVMRGTGLDLAELREYQHHDDVRHIDWNVTARLNHPHVRVYTEDREMAVWMVLDLSGSVNFGSGTRDKLALLQTLVGALALTFVRHGNRVGALLYQGGQQVAQIVPARTGRRHVLHLLHALQTCAAAPSRADTRGTDLSALLRAATHLVRRRSTVLVASDFISAPGWDKPLAQLSQRHDVVALRLLDPLEQDLPDLGLLTLRDAESGEHLLVDTSNSQFRQRFAKLASERETALRQAFSRARADVLELSTEGDVLQALSRFVALRRQRLRGPQQLQARQGVGHAAITALAAA